MFLPNKYLPSPHDPCHLPDLRWRRCLYLLRHRRLPMYTRDDEATRAGWRYLRDWLASRNPGERERLSERHPPVGAAHYLSRQATLMQRAEVEARLLARQDDEDIAARCGLTAAAVRAYHDLFFQVRDVLGAEFYIHNVVLGPQVDAGFSEDDTDILLKLLGYAHGPLMVDLALRYFRSPPVFPLSLEGLDTTALADLRLLLQLRVLILTLVTPSRTFAGRKLAPISQPTADNTKSFDGEVSAELSVASFLREQMCALAPAGPPATLPFGRSMLHAVPEWLSTSLARLCG